VSQASNPVTTHQWWKPKASSLLHLLYLVIFLVALPFARSLILLSAAVLTIAGIGTFGHLLNDWFDIESDRQAGKENRLAGFSLAHQGLVVSGALVVALVPWVILPFDRTSLILLGAEFLLLTLYAAPPVRIKQRISLAVFTDAIYAYALPAVLAAHTFFLASGKVDDRLFLFTLFTWQLLLGIRHFLNHIALDRLNDLRSGTRTLATTKGNYFLHHLIRNVILPLELISLAGFVWHLSHYSLYLALAVVVSFLFLLSYPAILVVARSYSFLSYRFSKTSLDTFYQDIMPLIPLLFLISRDLRFAVLLLAHFLLFGSANFKPQIDRSTLQVNRSPVLMLVGYPILLFKNVFQNGRTREFPNSEGQPNGASNRARPNIAVVNINRAKYTETFVNELIPLINYNVHYLHGGELPLYDDQGRHFLSGRGSIQAAALLLESIFQLKHQHFVAKSIATYLQTRGIKLVLAEFGPVGAQMFPITRDIGVPLLVYFHGYDAFHQPTWETQRDSYLELFREATRLLVVSQVMAQRLVQSGAPPEKLVHLPAFVNLGLFPYQDRRGFPPRFIAVGRFAETKSPHLTILAFQQVVAVIPEATLVMIGKGGGGELFEACLILTRALGLEDRVTFKGVLTHQEVAAEMAQARVFVQHSVTAPETGDMEGKPVAIMEAMASGLPVIATSHSGINELITNEVDGLLVNEYDIDAMAEKMILLATNDSLVSELGKNASNRICNDPLIRDHIKILEGIIQECLDSQ
jgi:glycosyltransferase involved in cell wall biosynthesis/4-hydroxybenzoate polyprenyltransferase